MYIVLDVMNRQRALECPVCGVGVTSRYLREHYTDHFRITTAAAAVPLAAIKASQARESLVELQSVTSTELQHQKRQKKHET